MLNIPHGVQELSQLEVEHLRQRSETIVTMFYRQGNLHIGRQTNKKPDVLGLRNCKRA